jgi:Asp-tRNA(Asn)/Glu-tRNA(Gln) amidotransferase B subunit
MPQPVLNHYSRVLGRNITPDTVDSIDPDDLEDVVVEVGQSLSAANAYIRTAGTEARSTGRYLPAPQWAELQNRRTFLAALHQKLLTKRSRLSRQEREQREAAAQAAKASAVPDLSHYFQQVVRNESRPADYQRWVLQAEMRRSADLTRIRQKELNHA